MIEDVPKIAATLFYAVKIYFTQGHCSITLRLIAGARALYLFVGPPFLNCGRKNPLKIQNLLVRKMVTVGFS